MPLFQKRNPSGLTVTPSQAWEPTRMSGLSGMLALDHVPQLTLPVAISWCEKPQITITTSVAKYYFHTSNAVIRIICFDVRSRSKHTRSLLQKSNEREGLDGLEKKKIGRHWIWGSSLSFFFFILQKSLKLNQKALTVHSFFVYELLLQVLWVCRAVCETCWGPGKMMRWGQWGLLPQLFVWQNNISEYYMPVPSRRCR